MNLGIESRMKGVSAYLGIRTTLGAIYNFKCNIWKGCEGLVCSYLGLVLFADATRRRRRRRRRRPTSRLRRIPNRIGRQTKTNCEESSNVLEKTAILRLRSAIDSWAHCTGGGAFRNIPLTTESIDTRLRRCRRCRRMLCWLNSMKRYEKTRID
jgi:hypothetical protein